MNFLQGRATTTVTLSSILVLSLFYKISTAKSDKNPLSCHLLLFAGFVLAAVLLLLILVAAARATMVAWITVLVLLTFSRTRRHVLARKGKTITVDMVMCLVRVRTKKADPRDCADLQRIIRDPSVWPAYDVYWGIFVELRGRFSFFVLVYIKRESSRQADALARHARDRSVELSFVDMYPPKDMNSLLSV